jgi:hypothetical protein
VRRNVWGGVGLVGIALVVLSFIGAVMLVPPLLWALAAWLGVFMLGGATIALAR